MIAALVGVAVGVLTIATARLIRGQHWLYSIGLLTLPSLYAFWALRAGEQAVGVNEMIYGIPFYVAAPRSTIDLATPDGSQIPIEERNPREVTHMGGSQLTPVGALIRNPAFDVTPHQLIAGIITERGILRPPYIQSLKQAFEPETAADASS